MATHTASSYFHQQLSIDFNGKTVLIQFYFENATESQVQALSDYLEQNKAQIIADLNAANPAP